MRPPTALSIASTDPCGGSGIQGDLKTFSALGVYGTTAITALVVQDTHGVRSTDPLDATQLLDQIHAVVEDLPIDATRIGGLADVDQVEAVAEAIGADPSAFGTVVLDPEVDAGTAHAVRDLLLPLAHVVTPSLVEAAELLGEDVADAADELRDQAQRLQALGAPVVVLSGRRLTTDDEALDVVAHPGGLDVLRGDRVATVNTHGTGSTFSSAIAAQYARIHGFARADELDEIGEEGDQDDDLTVVVSAREFLAGALAGAADWELSKDPEGSHGPLDHLITLAD